MKNLFHGQTASQHNLRLHNRRFCTLGAAACALISAPLMAGPMNQASAQDGLVQYVSTPLGKAFRVKGDTTLYHLSQGYRIETDTTYTYVDSSSDTIRRFTHITYEVVKDQGNPLVDRLTAWAAPLDPKGQEELLRENLKIGTLPGVVFQVAKNLHLSDAAIQRLQAAAGSGGAEFPAAGIQRRNEQVDALGLTTRGAPLNMQDRESMLRENLNLVGLPAGIVFQAAKNLGLPAAAIQRLQDTLKKRCDADRIVTDVADVHGLRDPKKQEEMLREYLAIGKEPEAVFLAAEKLNLPGPAIQRLRLFLREFYAEAGKRQH